MFVEARGPHGNDFRLSGIRLSCVSADQLRVGFSRGLASDEGAAPGSIRFRAAGQDVAFGLSGVVAKIESADAGALFETRSTVASGEFFQAAAAAGRLEIVETAALQAPTVTRSVTLATVGLSQALSDLRAKCHTSKPRSQ